MHTWPHVYTTLSHGFSKHTVHSLAILSFCSLSPAALSISAVAAAEGCVGVCVVEPEAPIAPVVVILLCNLGGMGGAPTVLVSSVAGGRATVSEADAVLASVILRDRRKHRSEEHTSELQSHVRISYAVFCLKKKKNQTNKNKKTSQSAN